MFTKIETVFCTQKKKKKLFTGLGSVRIVKNCYLGLENASLCLRPRAAFSRPRLQFFTIRTSQPANNIYIFRYYCNFKKVKIPLDHIFRVISGADPENSARGGQKMSRRERNITPYPQHMTGILGPIEKYHSKDSWLQKFFKKSEKWGGGGRPSWSLSALPLNPPMNLWLHIPC